MTAAAQSATTFTIELSGFDASMAMLEVCGVASLPLIGRKMIVRLSSSAATSSSEVKAT